jgi:hypothetical protein
MTQRQNLKIKELHYESNQQTASALKLLFRRKLIDLGFRFEIKENKTDSSEEWRINNEKYRVVQILNSRLTFLTKDAADTVRMGHEIQHLI